MNDINNAQLVKEFSDAEVILVGGFYKMEILFKIVIH